MDNSGHIVLSSIHPEVTFVSIETRDTIVTLRADTQSWLNVPAEVRRDGASVEFDHDATHLHAIQALDGTRHIGAYVTRRHPRWDRGETWQTVRVA